MPNPPLPIILTIALAAFPQTVDADPLVDALRSDTTRFNATRAIDELWKSEDPPIAELVTALDSDDFQQRQLAAGVLWRLLDPSPRHPSLMENPEAIITDRLLAVTIEGLASDTLPLERTGSEMTTTPYSNAAMWFHALSRHADRAKPMLLEGLESTDYQQRFLCALTLAYSGQSETTVKVLPILLPHLADNDIPEDAKWCVYAIHKLGHEASAPLREALEVSTDTQQRRLIELILTDLASPPATRRDLDSRRPLNGISSCVFDPAIEHPADDSMWWLRFIHAFG